MKNDPQQQRLTQSNEFEIVKFIVYREPFIRLH